MNLASKRIMLTGGAGFPGFFVSEKLKAMDVDYAFNVTPGHNLVPHKRYAHQAAKACGSKDVFIPAEQEYDTTTKDGYLSV